MSYVTNVRCLGCGQALDVQPFRYFCPACGGYLDVEYDYRAMQAELQAQTFERRRGSIMAQWREFLPIERPDLIDRVSLGEQPTPMTRARHLPPPADREEVWLKNESLLPTCSLKDRSMPLTIVKALELGFDTVGIVSSGNASASLAAYAVRAGVRAVVFVKAGASPSKLFKTMSYKPLAVQVQASYSATEVLFQQARTEFGFYDCDGLVNPYRIEGKKTFAYEVARDFGWHAPRAVYMPTGYGNGVVAAWKGFEELHRLGLIDSLPAIVAVQPAVCAPIARAWAQGLDQVEAVPEAESIAEAVCANDPVIGGQRVLQAVRASQGMVISVEESEIVEATRLLAEREGLAIEPTGAISLAGLLRLAREGNPYADGRQVISITGHALNSPGRAGRVLPAPVSVEPVYDAVRRAISGLL